KPAPISVLLKTDPEGTKVSTRHHTFGATPIALKLRPGNDYELTFEKPGYVASTKTYRITSQTRTIAITLKKSKPAPAAAAHPPATTAAPAGAAGESAESKESKDSKKSWWKLRFAR